MLRKITALYINTRYARNVSLLVDTKMSIFSSHGASQVALVVKNPPPNAGDIRDVGSIPVSRKSPREGNGTPLQYSCLRNSMDRRALQTIVYGVAKSWT